MHENDGFIVVPAQEVLDTRIHIDHNILRNRFDFTAVLTVSPGIEIAVHKVAGKCITPGEIMSPEEFRFPIAKHRILSAVDDASRYGIRTSGADDRTERIKDLQDRVKFLENVVYSVLKVNPDKIEEIRKLKT